MKTTAVAKYIEEGNEILFLDMEKVGLKEHQIIIMCSFNDMTEACKLFKECDRKQDLFQDVVRDLCRSYKILDDIYKDKELFTDFSNTCCLYCAGMSVLYNKDIPYSTTEELEAKGLDVYKISADEFDPDDLKAL